jgi:molybdopterin-guanine dinucleotide biosynthesis protein A
MSDRILGVVLAGGLATRMGGADKGLLQLGQQTILDEVLKRFRPQVSDIVLNVNGDSSRFYSLGFP